MILWVTECVPTVEGQPLESNAGSAAIRFVQCVLNSASDSAQNRIHKIKSTSTPEINTISTVKNTGTRRPKTVAFASVHNAK